MRKFKNQIALLLLILPLAVFCQRKDDIVIGKKYKIQSLVLNEIREYWIYLPESYNQSQSKYPVLVLLDGADAGGVGARSGRARYEADGETALGDSWRGVCVLHFEPGDVAGLVRPANGKVIEHEVAGVHQRARG